MEIADGLLSEDDELLTEILLNKYSAAQITEIEKTLGKLRIWVDNRDASAVKKYLNELRNDWETYKNALRNFGK